MSHQTIGDIMQNERDEAIKRLIFVASIVVYVAMLVYAGIHSWSLLTRGIAGDFLIWSIIGIVAMEISALALPAALHYWTFDPLQRTVALVFYAVDITLLIANVVIDWHWNAGDVAQFPQWLELYTMFVMPATPVIAGVFWSIIWLLDPAHKERAAMAKLGVATRQAMMNQIVAQAGTEDVNHIVSQAAEEITRELVAKMVTTNGQKPANGHTRPFGKTR